MEAGWARLHTTTGADSPEEVIGFWEELKSKEASMKELVRLAEEAEVTAKANMATLLNSRNAMLEAMASPDVSAARAEEELHALEDKIAEAQQRQAAATKQYNRVFTVCMSAQQGLRSLLGRLDEALALSAAQKGGAPGSLSPVRRSSSSMARSSIVDTAGTRKQSVAPQAGMSRRPSSMVEAAAARRHSSMAEQAIPENGAPDSVGSRRASKVGEAVRRSSTVARRSSVVTPSLAAILGKVDAAPDSLTFQDAAPAPALGSKLDKRAFFPDLVQLAKVVNERVGRLKSLSKRRSSMVQLSGAAGKPGQAAMLTEAAIKQGARRQTWMGPVYLGCPVDSDIGAVSGIKGAEISSKELLSSLVAYPATFEQPHPHTLEGKDNEEWDGVLDREFIKHRTAKLLAAAARHQVDSRKAAENH
ncbi:g9653 [Coccomyxa elongata]